MRAGGPCEYLRQNGRPGATGGDRMRGPKLRDRHDSVSFARQASIAGISLVTNLGLAAISVVCAVTLNGGWAPPIDGPKWAIIGSFAGTSTIGFFFATGAIRITRSSIGRLATGSSASNKYDFFDRHRHLFYYVGSYSNIFLSRYWG